MSGAATTFQCRHDSCSYRKRVWKDRRSRNVHEASARFHKCPAGCYRCDSKEASSPKELGQALCPHDGCNRLYNRRHMRAHMANEKLHRLQCSAACEECAKQGWECMGTGYHMPLPGQQQAGQQQERRELKLDDPHRLDGRPSAAASAVPAPLAPGQPAAAQLQEAMYMQPPMSSFDRAAVERFQMPEVAAPQRSSGPMVFLPPTRGLEHVRFDSLIGGSRSSLFKANASQQERVELARRRDEAVSLLSRVFGTDDVASIISFLAESLASDAYKPAPANGTAAQASPAAAQSLMQGMELLPAPADGQRPAATAAAAAAAAPRADACPPAPSGPEAH